MFSYLKRDSTIYISLPLACHIRDILQMERYTPNIVVIAS